MIQVNELLSVFHLVASDKSRMLFFV